MNNIVFKTFEPADLDQITPHSCYNHDESVKERMLNLSSVVGVHLWTILCPEGKPLAVMGGYRAFSRVGEIFAYVDERVVTCPLHYGRATRFLINHEFDRLGFIRLQVTVKADQPWAMRWARFLGFKPEGILQKYGEECEDHILFAKVR
jgi:hypothetical protein